ncbi:death ligand signal enhancer [Stigmatopora nigra]
MWRVKGLAWRVLHHYHTNTPLRLPQNHHVEDKVINHSTVLSSLNSSDSSYHKEEDGGSREKQRAFKSTFTELPRYTALDAVGWGASAVLFMQICRRIHSSFSSCTDSSPSSGVWTTSLTLQKCGYRCLLDILLRKDVVLRGGSAALSLHNQSSSGGSDVTQHRTEQNPLTPNVCITGCEEEVGLGSPLQDDTHGCPPEKNIFEEEPRDTDHTNNEFMFQREEALAEAAQNLQKVAESSVPVILNIIGLEKATSGNNEEAFTCFLAAAQHGYSKALFNTGVCYEKGRGVSKDKEKASHYYRRAAVAGHHQAQYRFAKLLLTSKGHQNKEEKLKMAISFLEKAAAAGLTKAQLCLASVYSLEPVRNGSKAVYYLHMAAESNDNTALLLLGQCYESSFGVQQNLKKAFELYKRAAQAGNKEAQRLLLSPIGTHMLRPIRSSPCFSVSDRDIQQLFSRERADSPSVALSFLPHSWSTGCIDMAPALSSSHLHSQGLEVKYCQWVVGVG